jgi:hypothetical protein
MAWLAHGAPAMTWPASRSPATCCRQLDHPEILINTSMWYMFLQINIHILYILVKLQPERPGYSICTCSPLQAPTTISAFYIAHKSAAWNELLFMNSTLAKAATNRLIK